MEIINTSLALALPTNYAKYGVVACKFIALGLGSCLVSEAIGTLTFAPTKKSFLLNKLSSASCRNVWVIEIHHIIRCSMNRAYISILNMCHTTS